MLTTHILLNASGHIQARSAMLEVPSLEGWLSSAVRRFGQQSTEPPPQGLRISLVRLEGTEPQYLATVQVPEAGRLEELTDRERQVAEFAAAGATSPEIARTLRISQHTVRQHLKEVYRKLAIASRFELRDLLER
jgi:DNA-binding NarL/FixJ family response regulator